MREDSEIYKLMKYRRETDTKVADINMRLYGKNSRFNQAIISDNKVAPTLTAGGDIMRMYDGLYITEDDARNVQSFPQDYDFGNQVPQYICGMSVPPVMMAQISSQVYEQWFKEK